MQECRCSFSFLGSEGENPPIWRCSLYRCQDIRAAWPIQLLAVQFLDVIRFAGMAVQFLDVIRFAGMAVQFLDVIRYAGMAVQFLDVIRFLVCFLSFSLSFSVRFT
jgi:hypothetical protein